MHYPPIGTALTTLVLIGLADTGCASDRGAFVSIVLSDLPSEVADIRVVATLDGQPSTNSVPVALTADRPFAFGLRLEHAYHGNFGVGVAARDPQGCTIAQGEASLELSGDPGAVPLEVRMTPRPEHARLCGALQAKTLSGIRGTTCVLRNGGQVYCWGLNNAKQTGIDGPDQLQAAAVPGLTGVVELAIGSEHSCARLGDSSVVCWGRNAEGQLGRGTIGGNFVAPMPVIGVSGTGSLKGVLQLAAGEHHNCALLSGGTVACWGMGITGQLGSGLSNNGTPVLVSSLREVREVTAGDEHSCARLASGRVKCWGSRMYGQLGDGLSGSTTAVPVDVLQLEDVVQLAANWSHTCAIQATGFGPRAYCWGWNKYGQLGLGSLLAVVSTPQPVSWDSFGPNAVPVGVWPGSWSTCALLADGRVACWGSNSSYRLGFQGPATSNPTVAVANLDGSTVVDAVQISHGNMGVCLERKSGAIACFGSDISGRMGDGAGLTPDSTAPIAVKFP